MPDNTIHEILVNYWGYREFRPLQEDIINSVLQGRDTLALLSTGGGKSICFQVPGLNLDGLTLVVTPLIALMKDQVERLKKHSIPAEAVYSGMSARETELALNHVIHATTRFLYISPERLASEHFRDILRNCRVKLIVVDEAHCISQWGYDFRPPYLRIAEIRAFFPDVPVLALTATATPIVAKDIQEKLCFRKDNVFEGTFERENLVYVVYNEENKLSRLLRIIKAVNGQGIVYVRNRRKTREIAEFLKNNRISADHYHAGLNPREREKRQNDWIKGYTRIIVCTNAFGMGIDKSDVRTVVHMDLPDSIEAYFQEAGRGGRDGKKSYSVLIFDQADIIDARQNAELAFPEIAYIKRVYRALANYYQLAVGTGKDLVFNMDVADFSTKFNFKPILAFNSLKFIEREGYISLNDAMYTSARFIFSINKQELYKFQVENKRYDNLIKTMQRSYGGSFTEPVVFNEAELSRRLGIEESMVKSQLIQLNNQGVLSYFPTTDKPQLTFVSELINGDDLFISAANYKVRKDEAIKRLDAIIRYATSTTQCRSKMLITYFGQQVKECGTCDICIERNKARLKPDDIAGLIDKLSSLLIAAPMNLNQLLEACKEVEEDLLIKAVSWLADNDKVVLRSDGYYNWHENK